VHHLHAIPILYTGISVLGVILFGYISIRRLDIGLVILLSEIILGGAGNFLSVLDINLRTWLLGTYAIIWGIHAIQTKQWQTLRIYPLITRILLGLTGLFILWGTVRGIYLGNGLKLVLQDAVLYGFLLLTFPCKEYTDTIKQHISPIITAFLIGTLSMITITFIRYSAGLGMIHDAYYTWIRDIAGGKVTDLGYGFFRIVSSEHLLIIPILVVLFALLTQRTNTKRMLYWSLIVLTITILLVNFTRIYFLAGIVGALVLLSGAHIKTWIRTTLICIAMSIMIFMSILFVASRGDIIGAELIGMKAASITTPQTDVSAATRLLIWPKAVEKLQAHPLLGSGLATSVTIIDPVTQLPTTRTQFDMGYVEMMTELGIIGTLIYILLILHIACKLWQYGQKKSTDPFDSRISIGLCAGIAGLSIVNLTTPALFQGYGVVFLAICLGGILRIPPSKTAEPTP
jgi:hypothetical protein